MNAESNVFPASPGVPPWMWYWCVMFTLNLLALFGTWYASYEVLSAYIQSVERNRAIDPQAERLAFLLYPGFFTENLPGIALFLGLFTILFPRLRAVYIEGRNRLVSPPPIKPLAEIEEFVRLHAPGLEVKVNLKRPGRIWVYPNGYRRATVAVFSGFVLLWKSDREAAEAVLLHEIAHYRRGDALFMGPGSFLENTVKLTLLFYVLFVALPYILIDIDQKIQLVASLQRIAEIGKSAGLETPPAPSYIPHLVTSVFLSFWGLLTTTAAFLVRTAASFILPVACMWAAELNADYFVANHLHYKEALLRELSKKNSNIGWWRWILFRLSHPPESLRRVFQRRNDSYAFSLMLLIFPLAMFVRIAILHVMTLFAYLGIGTSSAIAGQTTDFTWQSYLQSLVDITRLAITSNPFDWLLMAGLLLVWPVAVRPWERFFTRGLGLSMRNVAYEVPSPELALSIAPQRSPRFKYYVLAGTLTSILFLVALVWRQ